MTDFSDAFLHSLKLIFTGDPEIWGIISLSLIVSFVSVMLGGLAGVMLGVFMGMRNFPFKGALEGLLNTFMGTPPVVVGLVVFLLLSRAGPLGGFNLLFTPTAMIIAQTVLVFPIVAALSHSAISSLDPLLKDGALTLGASPFQAGLLVVFEARHGIMAALIAGFGRAISEVGAVLMVGGNIREHTRVMTTTIALQTSMGNFEPALSLGIVLIFLALLVNMVFHRIQRSGAQ